MGRKDLFITVPSLFKCPISLDVMKSPVSLCTGVTYERSNIQKWLDSGNNTCPATMQVLHSKDFVPNHTLHRLIQVWSDSVNNLSESDVSPPCNFCPHISRQEARYFIKNIQNRADNCFDCLSKIADFAKNSDENRKFLAKIDGFFPVLFGVLGNVDVHCDDKIRVFEQTIMILDLILNDYGNKERLMRSMGRNQELLASIFLVLQKGSLDSRIGSAKLLEAIAIDPESKLLIAGKEGMLFELLSLINSETDPKVIHACLSCLITISSPRRIKQRIVGFGAVQKLGKLLSQLDSDISIIEKALKLLQMVSTCTEGRTAICEDPICVTAIVGKMLKVSKTSTEDAAVILWSVCYLFRDQKAQEAVLKSNGLTKILLLMQSNCSPSVRKMCSDLIKIFRVNSKSCLSCYETKTKHIMPF